MERFVAAKLTEVFGRTDIVAYLAERPEGPKFDSWRNVWFNLIKRAPSIVEGQCARIIAEIQEPIVMGGISGLPIYDFIQYFLCENPEIKVYDLGIPRVVLVEYPLTYQGKAMGRQFCVVGREESNVTAQDVASRIIYHHWAKEKDRLLKPLQEWVGRVKDEAKKDYAEACAVYANGVKIVKADRVILVGASEKHPIFPGDSFSDSKIEIPGDPDGTVKTIAGYSDQETWKAIGMVKRGEYKAILVTANNVKLNSDLVVAEEIVTQVPEYAGSVPGEIL